MIPTIRSTENASGFWKGCVWTEHHNLLRQLDILDGIEQYERFSFFVSSRSSADHVDVVLRRCRHVIQDDVFYVFEIHSPREDTGANEHIEATLNEASSVFAFQQISDTEVPVPEVYGTGFQERHADQKLTVVEVGQGALTLPLLHVRTQVHHTAVPHVFDYDAESMTFLTASREHNHTAHLVVNRKPPNEERSHSDFAENFVFLERARKSKRLVSLWRSISLRVENSGIKEIHVA